jgi:hypothetical protein
MNNAISALMMIILVAVSTADSLCHEERRVEDTECRLMLNKTDFYAGELISIEFIWKSAKSFQSGIAGDLMSGRACLQFIRDRKVVHTVPLAPFSAPRRKGDSFSISTAIPVRSGNYLFQKGEYQLQAVSKRWKTGLAAFNVHTPELSCRIEMDRRTVVPGSSCVVYVTTANISDHKIDLKAIPAFYVDGRKFWCPVEIVRGGGMLPADTRSHIVLEKGASITAKIDLAEGGWDLCISSVWPSKDLCAVVPPGHHELHLDIELVQERTHIDSNIEQFQVSR